jgi:hypothetical protein
MSYTNGLDDPSAYFQTALYTGTGSSLANTFDGNSAMQPDFVWIKERSGVADHALYDSSRGVEKQIESNTTAVETTETTGLTAFGSDGFTVGALAQVNTSSDTYVAWNWKANGGTTASNTDGDITSTVQANTDAGFSIITYTGSGTTDDTIGHGLGVAPDIAIFKRRDVATSNWDVQESNGGVTGAAAFRHTLNLLDGIATNVLSTFSSTTIGLSTGGDAQKNVSGSTYVCYAFKAKQGYSRFGTYYGNGSTDGAYVHLGFKPALVIFKVLSDPNYGWSMIDNKRSPSNLMNNDLYANSTAAEVTNANNIDFLSNGFKCRGSTYPANAGGTNTFSYFAWAENPFVTSTGVPTTAR